MPGYIQGKLLLSARAAGESDSEAADWKGAIERDIRGGSVNLSEVRQTPHKKILVQFGRGDEMAL